MKILPRITAYLWLLTPFALIATIIIVAALCGMRLNISSSMEQGVWQKVRFNTPASHSVKGSIVTFCPSLSNPYLALAAKRHYLSSGNCSNGLMPLLKPVVATTGDIITLSKEQLTVNGVAIPHSTVQDKDSKGNPLPHYPFRSYKVATDELWLLAPSHSHSFDSRYFGPVKVRDIQHIMQPFFTWNTASPATSCSHTISKKTLAAVIHAESGGNPWIIGNNTLKKRYIYADYTTTTHAANAFITAGHNIDIGLMQVNSSNLPRLNLTPEQAIEPCTNIHAGSIILLQFYGKALRYTSSPQVALRYALSGYNTGSLYKGYRYAEQVALQSLEW
jgi:conjugative transfer signal peptidase TraF